MNPTRLEEAIRLAPIPENLVSTQLFPRELRELLAEMHRCFNPKRLQLLQARQKRQLKYDQGELPQYLPTDTLAVNGDWKIHNLFCS